MACELAAGSLNLVMEDPLAIQGKLDGSSGHAFVRHDREQRHPFADSDEASFVEGRKRTSIIPMKALDSQNDLLLTERRQDYRALGLLILPEQLMFIEVPQKLRAAALHQQEPHAAGQASAATAQRRDKRIDSAGIVRSVVDDDRGRAPWLPFTPLLMVVWGSRQESQVEPAPAQQVALFAQVKQPLQSQAAFPAARRPEQPAPAELTFGVHEGGKHSLLSLAPDQASGTAAKILRFPARGWQTEEDRRRPPPMLDGNAGHRFATGKNDSSRQESQDRLPGAEEEPCLHVRAQDFQDRKLLFDELVYFVRLQPAR